MSFTKTRTVLTLLTCVVFMLILGCDSTDHVIIQDNISDPGAVRLAPRNPETYLVYIQPDDPVYHLMHFPCLKDGREIVTEAEALEQGYTPCEVCFPPPPEPLVPKVYILADSDQYHGMLCPLLDDTKVAIPKAEALEAGYTACPRCFPQDYVPPPPSVYILPGSTEYHFMICDALTDEKVIITKEEALELGYTPHECALELTIHGGVVYVTETGQEDGIYHTNRNCKHLDHLSEEEKNEIIQVRRRMNQGFRKCKDCDEERHIDE